MQLSIWVLCAHVDSALKLWTTLDGLNQSLARTLLSLTDLYEKDKAVYTEVVKYISSMRSDQVSRFTAFHASASY